MKIIRAKDYRDMSRKAANFLSAQVILKNNSVLGLATGDSVLGVYETLIHWYEQGDLDFSSVTTVNLDEYVGLSPDNPQSYRYYMEQHFFRRVNLLPENTHLPDGLAADLTAECRRYDRLIEGLAGIDMQLLGLGYNGHIGFNEPDEAFEKQTHVVKLKESTKRANSRFFQREEEVPGDAVTMGIKSIMQARRIILCVCGAHKAEILRRVLTGPVTPSTPGSILQMHPAVTVVADEAALSKMGV